MENISYALYQFLGIVFFLTALTLLYQMDTQLNNSIDYQIQHLHKQKALTYTGGQKN